MFGYRAGKYPVTAKALRKLAAAEQAAGIGAVEDVPEIGNAESSAKLNESPPPQADLLEVLTRIATALEALVAHADLNNQKQ